MWDFRGAHDAEDFRIKYFLIYQNVFENQISFEIKYFLIFKSGIETLESIGFSDGKTEYGFVVSETNKSHIFSEK